jgi:MGT family glycosyltransferase
MTTRQPAGMAAASPASATAEHVRGSGQREPRMKILVAGWDSGGGVEAVQTVVRRAVARGHEVRVLGTAGLRDRFESAGAAFGVYRYAPDNDMRRPETDLVKEWQARTPMGAFARVRDRVMFGPARQFCRDIVEELDREPADVVAVDTLIPAALSGAEAAGVPAVLLMHGPYALPRPGAPLIGTGFLPPRGRPGRLRDRATGSLAMGLFRTGLPALNQARAEFGLAPLRDLGELADSASRILVCTSPGYDFAAGAVPGNVRYVGPQLEDSGGAAWDDPRAGAGDRPLVLVSFSSTVMRQDGLLQKAADALGQLPVYAVMTTGPAVDPAVVQAPPNVSVRRWARHADVLPSCSAVLTHGGHGTVIKALAAGVPLVIVPLGRDQPGNAARVVHAGAGVRVRKNAGTAALRAVIGRVLDDHRYLAAARRMAALLAAERDDGLVVDELERAAACGRPATDARRARLAAASGLSAPHSKHQGPRNGPPRYEGEV